MKGKDGKEYPLIKIEVSAESHPFYTGKHKIVDTAGRVEKFKRRYATKGPSRRPETGRAVEQRPPNAELAPAAQVPGAFYFKTITCASIAGFRCQHCASIVGRRVKAIGSGH